MWIKAENGINDAATVKEKVREILLQNMQDGVLHVPKEYGLFITK